MRWDAQRRRDDDPAPTLPGLEEEAVVRRFDAPEALDTRFHEVHARTVLNRVGGAPHRRRVPFGWTVNPYRGCSHACRYCFARPTHEYLGLGPGRDFEREIVVKVNTPERLRADLARRSRTAAAGDEVALGTNTDPYQWVESRYRLMPGVWDALLDADVPGSVLTKSPLVLRDADRLVALHDGPGLDAALSIPTLDERAWRATEPHTPHPRTRFAAVAELTRRGIPTAVLVAPLMPGINDAPHQVEALLRAADDAGARSVRGMGLFLRGSTRDLFLEWLTSARPDLAPLYEELYRHGTHMPRAEAQRLAALVHRGERAYAGDAHAPTRPPAEGGHPATRFAAGAAARDARRRARVGPDGRPRATLDRDARPVPRRAMPVGAPPTRDGPARQLGLFGAPGPRR
ncbi:MAG: radical SAM protein [Solirubrobacteraceae bacterium]|nr:radical SAM protein [Solirubrobacteraceae bacterium]